MISLMYAAFDALSLAQGRIGRDAPRRHNHTMAIKILLAVAALYLTISVALFLGQGAVIFPSRVVPPAGPLPPGAERLHFVAPDGVRLEGIHIRGGSGPRRRTLILGFAGNASNAQGIAEFLHELYPGHPVIAFHYRGYPPSGGITAAATMLDDAPLLFDLAINRVRPDRVVAVGISLGSGIAAGLSTTPARRSDTRDSVRQREGGRERYIPVAPHRIAAPPRSSFGGFSPCFDAAGRDRRRWPRPRHPATADGCAQARNSQSRFRHDHCRSRA